MVHTAAASKPQEHKLRLREVLSELVAAGLLGPDVPPGLRGRSDGAGAPHPLIVIAECELPDARHPGKKLDLETLLHWLSDWTGLEYQRIDPLSVDVGKVTSVISHSYAKHAHILPVQVTPDEIVVATCEPFLRAWERELAPIVKRQIRRVIASPLDIQRYLGEFYAIAHSIKEGAAEHGRTAGSNIQNLEQLIELGRRGKLDANDHHVVAIVDWLLRYAFEQRASDIHAEPRRDTGNFRFRIDGVLHEVYQMPAAVMAPVTSRIKILARMDLAEKRRPQDGRIKTRTPDGKEIELRVSSLPTAFGEKLVMRIFDPDVLVKDFTALGFSANDARRWDAMIRAPNGIVLVTGPTGSGKTTTLYSTLKLLATSDVNVCTIEDPIELVEPSFNQMQVQPNIELSFAAGVRALMRQDPDIIMVGEIRDLETAEVAIQAALTGHLVLSTVHTNDAPATITRLLDLGVPPYLLKSTLLGVMAQRLLRKLCSHCKKPMALSDARWREVVGDWKVPTPKSSHEPVGCVECRQTGFLGRSGIYEIMTLSPALKERLTADTDLARFQTAALQEGMVPLRIAGAQKIAAGLTSVDEVLATTPPSFRDH
ncbi:MAG: GspE/PulE family protein [Nevskiales bacterium]|nr:GspE/PulE family protein [Nevskiales bacterium]